jgi:energy-converting hydrogenase Eha subunit E
MPDPLRSLAVAQGLYFLATGVWPLVSIRTFEAVTGPKADDWLVKTVGVQVAVVGAVLVLAGSRGEVSPEIVALATGSALGLMGIDVWYVARGVIPRIYLMDAACELVLSALWVAAWSLRGPG